MTETIRLTVTVDSTELRRWAEWHADAGHQGVAHVLYQAAAGMESLSEQAIREAKAEALRELRDYLANPRRVWFGDMGVRVALDIDDPRSHLALSTYLDLRADRIEQGGQP